VGDPDLEMYELAADQPEGEPLPDSSRRRWYRVEWATPATIALWALAAAAAIAAPFTSLVGFRETFRPDGTIGTDMFTHRIDGWGRIRDFSPNGTVSAQLGHEARYGIATCACAALLLVAIASLVLGRTGRSASVARDVALVAASLLAGVVTAEYLHVESARSQIAAASESSRGSLSFDLQIGPALCLGLAAVVGGAAGVVAARRAKTRDRD
jgi:hypothetical protein